MEHDGWMVKKRNYSNTGSKLKHFLYFQTYYPASSKAFCGCSVVVKAVTLK
jgi:hypothetical protein